MWRDDNCQRRPILSVTSYFLFLRAVSVWERKGRRKMLLFMFFSFPRVCATVCCLTNADRESKKKESLREQEEVSHRVSERLVICCVWLLRMLLHIERQGTPATSSPCCNHPTCRQGQKIECCSRGMREGKVYHDVRYKKEKNTGTRSFKEPESDSLSLRLSLRD